MANANKLNGFTPVASLISADYDGRGRPYAIPAANTNQIAVGDPVKLIAGTDTKFGLPAIDIGAANAALIGVCIGLMKPPPQGTIRGGAGPWVDITNLNNILFRPAAAQTTDWYALVIDDPFVIYEVQDQTSSGAGVQFPVTAATKNVDFGRLAAGAVTPGFLSPSYVDNLGTGVAPNLATSNFRLIGLKQSIDNAPGAFQRWLCVINNHAMKAGVVGV
jgi:hypothetical protein